MSLISRSYHLRFFDVEFDGVSKSESVTRSPPQGQIEGFSVAFQSLKENHLIFVEGRARVENHAFAAFVFVENSLFCVNQNYC